MERGLGRQGWAFLAAIVAGVLAVGAVVGGRIAWATALAIVAAVAWGLARAWSRRAPGPMPYLFRWILLLPRGFQTPARLKMILQPRPGERMLEVGPGVGVHALPIASGLAPDGLLDVLDVQQAMLDDLVRRARRAGIHNIPATRGDARQLPYADEAFDAAYLIGVLGEVPDEQAALRELRRVLKPEGRLVVGEIVVDPDFIPLQRLTTIAAHAGFVLCGKAGPGVCYLALFRPDRRLAGIREMVT